MIVILEKFKVEVEAIRRGLNWKTEKLLVSSKNGEKIKFI